MPCDQARMPRKHIRHQFPRRQSPDKLKETEQKQCFTDSEKERRHHVGGPMRAQVNSRISNRQSDKPVQPAAAPVKQSTIRCGDRVVYSVSRRKRRSRASAIRGIRKPNDRFLKKGKKLWPGLL